MDGLASQQLAALARRIVDENAYMVLGTAAADGRPWSSPVYYAPDGNAALLWVSDPRARHSRNIASRPEVSVVIFDSRQPIGTGQGVYAEARAEEVSGAALERGIAVFSQRSIEHGVREWTPEMVRTPARLRLYRATVTALYVVDGDDARVQVEP